MPRFQNEMEAIEYIAQRQQIASSSAASKYAVWRKEKRAMFSPKELEEYERGNRGQQKDIVNKWADEEEGLPRRRAIIVVVSHQVVAANNLAKQIDPIQDLDTFGGAGLSASGKTPVTHYGCSWNCSESEYGWLQQSFQPTQDIHFYDGDKTTWQEVLKDMGLIEIEEPLEGSKIIDFMKKIVSKILGR